MNHVSALVFSLLGVLCIVAPSAAQFPGDAFFREPSVTAEQNGLVEMDVEFFGGGSALGAAHYEVVFDPNQLSIEAILGSTATEFSDSAVFRARTDRAVGVHWNSQSSTGPIGTVHLMRIVFRVLAPQGTVAQLQVVARDFVDATGVRYPSIRGANGSISVTGPGSQPSPDVGPSGNTPSAEVEPAALKLAGTMRRAGSLVRFWMPVWGGSGFTAMPIDVAIPPLPGTASDAVPTGR
jgi:hypothetical protein